MENVGNTIVESPKSMSKKEFYDMIGMSYINMYIDPEKKRKKIKGAIKLPSEAIGWQNWSKKICEKYNKKADPKCNSFNVNLEEKKKPQFVVVDCDKEEVVEEILKREGTSYMTLSSGSGLPHLLRRRHPDDNNTTSKHKGYDYLYKNVFELMEGDIENVLGDSIEDIPYFMNFEKVETKPKTKKPRKKRTILNTQENRELNREDLVSQFGAENIEIIENIDARYIDDYNVWLKLIWGLYNEFQSVSLCNYLSSRGDPSKYEDATQKIMNDTKQSITYGTVIHYSKESNLEKYIEIRSNHNDLFGFDASDDSFKNLYFKLFSHELKKSGNHIYVYKNPYWETCDSELLATFVANCLLKFINSQIEHTEEDRLEKLTQLKTLRKTMGSWSKQKSVGKVIMNNLDNCDIEFDNKPNYFCFKNCAINLDTGEKVKIEREDYITIHTGYEKINSTQEQRNVLHEVMSKIFPDKQELQSFYTLLKVTLYGKQDKQFHVFRGNGSNAKGMLCEHFERVMGNYFYKPNKEFLLNKLSEGVNEVLSNMDRKRLINFTELAKDDKIRAEIIKVLTDAPTITARGIYEKNHVIHLHGSVWIDTNPEINIFGDIDYSIERRFVYWFFRSTFVDNPKYLTRGDNFYMKDERFKDITFIINNRSTWIDLILEKTQGINKLHLCDSIVGNTKKALNNMDDILDFIEPRYERTENPDDYIELKDMYTQFRQTEEFCDMTKEERRKWSKKKFAESVKKNINFVGDFRERFQKNGLNLRSIFLNWREIK